MLEMKRREKKVRRRPRIGTRIQGKLGRDCEGRKVPWNSCVDFQPTSDVCHAHAIDNTTGYRKNDIRKCELWGKGDECPLVNILTTWSLYIIQVLFVLLFCKNNP